MAKYEKVESALQISEQRNKEKDVKIQEQQTKIENLTQRINEFKSKCIDFIKGNIPKTFDVMNALAKKLNLVKDVNESINQDKEHEKQILQEQQSSSKKIHEQDWDMER